MTSLAVLAALICGAQTSVAIEDVEPLSKRAQGERPLEVLAALADDADRERLRTFFTAIPEPARRARAIHDWVVTRLSYKPGSPDESQAPEVVLRRRTGNCDGYSRLFEALGNAAGLEVSRIFGVARDATGQPQAHAWNAVKLNGDWKLVDATFDDPQVSGVLAEAEGFRTDYFLVTPEVAVLDHLPTDAKWLLGAKALTREQFLSQGADRATTRRAGVSVGPTRFVEGVALTPVRNERARFLLLRVDGRRCGEVATGQEVELTCPADDTQPHHFELFANDTDTGRFRTAAEWATGRR